MAILTPTKKNLGENTQENLILPDVSTPIDAYYLDPSAAGTMTDLEKANYYDYMSRVQGQGQNVYGQQQSLIAALQAKAEGRGGPSIAEMQLQQSLNANRQDAARTLAGAGRGINPALARRLLMQQQGTLNQTAAGQAAILRAQEQQAAQTALGNTLQGVAGTQAGLYGQAGQLGLNQAKSVAELSEAQKARDVQVALANQKAAQVASGQASEQTTARDATNAKMVGDVAGEVAKGAGTAGAAAIAAAADGGIIRRRYAEGGRVKAAMGSLQKMDNEKNDVVPAMLSPGEIVLPRSIVNAPNAPVAAAKFVEALLANKNKKDAKIVALKAALSNR
jgi:hypothetical protein